MARSTRPFSLPRAIATGPWFVTILPREPEQRRMEANRVAAPFQYHTLKIVVQQNTGHPAPCLEGGGMAAQEALHPGIRKEAEKNPPRMTEHHDEGPSADVARGRSQDG